VSLALAFTVLVYAGKQAHLLHEGWGDDDAIQEEVLNKYYDPECLTGYPKHVHTNLARVDESSIDYDLLDDLVRHIDTTEDEGAILVFLPGMVEIMSLVDRLQGSHQYDLPTHASTFHRPLLFMQPVINYRRSLDPF
jgi:hypothetical protein